MSYVVIGCDINSGNDHKWQDTIASELKKNGHETEKLQIAPNPFASYSYNTKAKGKIGVYIIADGLFSIGDLYYGNTYFKYAYFLIRGDLGHTRMDSKSDFENNPISADADTRGEASKLAGKTYPQMNKITKSKCLTVWGGKTPSEGAKNLISAMGGGTGDDESKGGAGSNIKDCIQKLLKHWDGDVECYIRGDEVHINKVRDPDEYHSCILKEEVNVITDSVTLTDVNPDTVNHLTVTWTGGKIEFKDEKAIARFGEKPLEIPAVRKVTKVVEEEVEADSSDTDTDEDTE